MARIFISYRRSDDPSSVGRVRDRLREFYGADAVFRDIDGIPKGTRFAEVIDAELASCKIMLVVIGPHWLEATDADGNRRLDQPHDWVRGEIELGLARKSLRIVPLIVGGATLPTPDQLPESIRGLLEWNAATLADDSFDHDFDVLEHDLGGHRRVTPVVAILAIALLVMAAVVGFVILRPSHGSKAPPTAAGAPGSSGGGSAAGPRTAFTPGVTTTTAPARMSGGFNVAVADFAAVGAVSGTASAEAHVIALRLADRLKQDLAAAGPGSDIQVRGPDQVGSISGDTKQRHRAAEDLARQIGANVVIDARVDFADPSSISQDVWLSPSSLADSPELGGYYALTPIRYPGSYTNLHTKDQLVAMTAAANAALANFIRGVSYYSDVDADRANAALAERSFQSALSSPSLPDRAKEGAEAFLGSLALLRDDRAVALVRFEQAVKINSSSTRGNLGLAELSLLESEGVRCAAGTINAAGLDKAIGTFAAVSPSELDEPGAALKARLGQARALRCRSQAGGGSDFASVKQILEQVIAAAGKQPALKEMVATAHAELALTIAPPAGAPDPAALNASLAETRLAVATTARPQNKAVYLWQEAFYLAQLHRDGEASAALAQATKLDPSFAPVRPSDLLPEAAGRLVPAGDKAPGTVSDVAVLPYTGGGTAPLLLLGMGLMLTGFGLLRAGRRWRAG